MDLPTTLPGEGGAACPLVGVPLVLQIGGCGILFT